MKKIIGLLVLFSGYAFSSGIPTVDLAQLAQREAEFLQQIDHWQKQISQYKENYDMFEKQYKQAQEQYKSLTGIRDLSSALSYLNSQSWNMDDLTKWLSEPDKILNAGFDSLTTELRTKVTELGFGEMCNYKNSDNDAQYSYKLRKNCEGRVVISLLQSAKYEGLVRERNKQDKKLAEQMKEIAQSKDSKQSADYTNQLLGQLIQHQVKLQRMVEDNESQKNSERLQNLKEEADFKAWLSQYEK
ncbi:type IV secretion system protein [Orbus sturtevantii]|uniref:type IV secretion system protein n=1 Tax=Orbus sturtevantii TaxID=3074109 RepID=UPI00370DD85A